MKGVRWSTVESNGEEKLNRNVTIKWKNKKKISGNTSQLEWILSEIRCTS